MGAKNEGNQKKIQTTKLELYKTKIDILFHELLNEKIRRLLIEGYSIREILRKYNIKPIDSLILG